MAEDKDDHQDRSKAAALSESQLDMILAAIQAKWKGSRACPICTTDDWALTPNATTPVPLKGLTARSAYLSRRVYPIMQVICKNCGFTHHFNLAVLGIKRESLKTEAQSKIEDGKNTTEASDAS